MTGQFSQFKKELRAKPLLPLITVCLIAALLTITYMVSFGSLIFSGDLAPYLSSGIGFCLMGAVIITSLEALFSGSPGLVAIPAVNSAIILAAVSAGIATALKSNPEALFPTVTAAITVAGLATGIVFVGMGWFKLGNLIRFIPYPVIGGFLAGTGWLVISGAFKTMADTPLTLATIPDLFQPELLWRWLPGVLFGVVTWLLVRRFRHYLILPSMILGGVALFYLVMGLTNTSISQASELGFLFKPFPAGGLWQPPPFADFQLVEWGAILAQTGAIATLILISSITLLLYSSGVEVSAAREIDLNQELRACGTANLAAAFTASPPGYVIVTMSVLSSKMGVISRLVGLLIAAICAGVMFFGGSLLSLIPRIVLGGVLTYVALTFLSEWLYDGWRKLSHVDYAIVVLIMLIMSNFGLLAGLGIGLAIAAGLFIVQYSRVPVVHHTLSGRTFRSRVERPAPHVNLLRQAGAGLLALNLQGYLFFGTANRVYQTVREHLESHEHSLRLVLLDFRRVSGIDASAGLSFLRLKRLLSKEKVILGFAHLNPGVEEKLKPEVLTAADQQNWRIFPDIDRGVEWYEELVLQGDRQEAVQAQAGTVQPGQEKGGLALLFSALSEQSGEATPEQEAAALALLKYLERRDLESGERLIQQGELGHCLYFLDAGGLLVEFTAEHGEVVRLATSGPGTIVGELSMYLGAPASATVTATQPSVAYCLSSDSLKRLELEQPASAAVLHRFLLKRVSQRLQSALETVEALSE
jgi:SulP family sulfate permease